MKLSLKTFVLIICLQWISIPFFGNSINEKYYKHFIVTQTGWKFTGEIKNRKRRRGWFYKVTYDSKNYILKYERYSSQSAPYHVVTFENAPNKKSTERKIVQEKIYHFDGQVYEINYFNSRKTKLFTSESITNQVTGYLFVSYYNQSKKKLKTVVYNKGKKPLYQYFYNQDEKVILEEYLLNGKVYLTQAYNNMGQLVKKEEYWENREEYLTTLYTYNQKGKKVRREIHQGDKYLGYYLNYYKRGQFTSQEFYSSSGDSLYQIKYFERMISDNDGPPKFQKKISPDNLNPSRYYQIYYDDQGRIARYDQYINRHLFSYSQYYFNNKGKLVSEEQYNKERAFLTIKKFNLPEKNLQTETWQEILKNVTLKGNNKVPVRIERYNHQKILTSAIVCYYNQFEELEKYELYHKSGKLYAIAHFLNRKPLREEFYNTSGRISYIREYDLSGNLNSTHFMDTSPKVESGTPEFVDKDL